jgi:hypothetical protein
VSQAKARGTIVSRAVRFLRSLEDDARAILPGNLHRYLTEQVMADAWYSEKDLLGLIRGCVELIDLPKALALKDIGKWTAREHYALAYPDLAKQPEPQEFIKRLEQLWHHNHDSGSLSFLVDGPVKGSVQVEGFEYPSQEMCTIYGAYYVEMSKLAGWGEVNLTRHDCVLQGEPVCRWDLGWTVELPADSLPRTAEKASSPVPSSR